jgi:hypothetical protein
MLRRPLLLTVWAAYGLLITGCAAHTPQSAPILTLPQAARTPCQLPRLPDSPTIADLEVTHDARGLMLAVCDGRRDLAVQSFDAQSRALAPPSRPWWRRLMGG